MKTLLSFVIPCYRSELTIEKVIDEIIDTVSQRSESYDYEIICVNDSSPDNVLAILKNLAANNHKIKVIDLAKNMGKHAATIAAMTYLQGMYCITVDDDFQCPTYELWKLIEPLEKNECDFATAHYPEKKETPLKKIGSKVNAVMTHWLIDRPSGVVLSNFGAMKRFVVDEIIKYDNPYPYIDGLIYKATSRIKCVTMEERERADSNESGYTFHKSLSLWVNGFTAFSVKPLRVSAFLGIILAVLGFIFGLVIIIRKVIYPEIAAGYTSMMSVTLFVGGLILMSLGLIGEYIGRIYICINNSPQYVIREKINFSPEKYDQKMEVAL